VLQQSLMTISVVGINDCDVKNIGKTVFSSNH
jgi:hypothetical protein